MGPEYSGPLLQYRNFQEIGDFLSYKGRMSSIECCAAPLGGERFERFVTGAFLGYFW